MLLIVVVVVVVVVVMFVAISDVAIAQLLLMKLFASFVEALIRVEYCSAL